MFCTSLRSAVIPYWPFQGGGSVVVLCGLIFWCRSFGGVSPYVCSYYFSSVWVAAWPHFGLNSIYLVTNMHIKYRYIQCYVRQDLAVSVKLMLKPFSFWF